MNTLLENATPTPAPTRRRARWRDERRHSQRWSARHAERTSAPSLPEPSPMADDLGALWALADRATTGFVSGGCDGLTPTERDELREAFDRGLDDLQGCVGLVDGLRRMLPWLPQVTLVAEAVGTVVHAAIEAGQGSATGPDLSREGQLTVLRERGAATALSALFAARAAVGAGGDPQLLEQARRALALSRASRAARTGATAKWAARIELAAQALLDTDGSVPVHLLRGVWPHGSVPAPSLAPVRR